MSWVRLDDGFAGHPKVAGLSDKAFRAFVTGLCHCGQYLTDGVIAKATALRIATKPIRDELFAAQLWHERTDGGVDVHDWSDYNRDSETVKEERRRKSEAGRLGAQKRWEGKAEGMADAMARAMAGANGSSDAPIPSHPDPSQPGSDGSEGLFRTSAFDLEGIDESKLRIAEKLLDTIEDRTDDTAKFLLPLIERGSEAALAYTLEALKQRRALTDRKPLESESRWVRHTLSDYIENGKAPTYREAA